MNSFQLAKFLSQLIASRRRKTPLHSDEEERKKRRLKRQEGWEEIYSQGRQAGSGSGSGAYLQAAARADWVTHAFNWRSEPEAPAARHLQLLSLVTKVLTRRGRKSVRRMRARVALDTQIAAV